MLIARFQGFRKSAISRFRGYELRVRGNGGWQVAANGPATVTLASGRVTAARSYGLGSLGYYPVRYPGFTVRPQ